MRDIEIDLEVLDRMIDYNPVTGLAYFSESRIVSPKQRGKNVRTRHPDGYYRVTIDGVHYPLHRLLWFLYYGIKPRSPIIHLNGNKADNRIKNLTESANRELPQPRERFAVLFGGQRERERKFPDEPSMELKPPWE